MKVWVETRTIEPPEFTVSARFGASIMFVGYSKITQQWFWLQPNGIIEKINEPPLIFVDDDYVRNNLRTTPKPRSEKPVRMHRGRRSDQMILEL